MKIILAPERKCYGAPLIFNPNEGRTIIEPPAAGRGNWAGAPSVLFDAHTSSFYLYYRVRRPRPVRGGECYIAESKNGINFHPIWRLTKEDLNSPSLERACLTKTLDDKWLLYISCLLYTSPSPRDRQKSRMPSSA